MFYTITCLCKLASETISQPLSAYCKHWQCVEYAIGLHTGSSRIGIVFDLTCYHGCTGTSHHLARALPVWMTERNRIRI